MIEQHYTPAEVALLFKVSEETILRACREDRMESFVVPGGRARRIPESAIEAWLLTGSTGRKVTSAVTELRRAG